MSMKETKGRIKKEKIEKTKKKLFIAKLWKEQEKHLALSIDDSMELILPAKRRVTLKLKQTPNPEILTFREYKNVYIPRNNN